MKLSKSPLFVFAIVVALAPLNALYNAWIFSSLWDLLVRPQYGAGPSYESWYGISTLFGLATMGMAPRMKPEDATHAPVTRMVTVWAVMLITLGIAHGVRAVLGWP